MSIGFRISDANGNVVIDATTGLAKYIGEFQTTQTVGSITNPKLKDGRVWVMLKSIESGSYRMFVFPTLTYEDFNETISWDFSGSNVSSVGNLPAVCTFIYGIY